MLPGGVEVQRGRARRWLQSRLRRLEQALKDTRLSGLAPLVSESTFIVSAGLLLLLLLLLVFGLARSRVSGGLSGDSMQTPATVFLHWDACLEAVPALDSSDWGCVCGLPRQQAGQQWDLRRGSALLPSAVRVHETLGKGPTAYAQRNFKENEEVARHDVFLISPPPRGRAWTIPVRLGGTTRAGSENRHALHHDVVELHPAQYGLTVDCSGDSEHEGGGGGPSGGETDLHMFEGWVEFVHHISESEHESASVKVLANVVKDVSKYLVDDVSKYAVNDRSKHPLLYRSWHMCGTELIPDRQTDRYTPVHAHGPQPYPRIGDLSEHTCYACWHILVYATTGMRRSFRGGSGGAAGASIHHQDVCSPRYCPGDRSVSNSSNVCITS